MPSKTRQYLAISDLNCCSAAWMTAGDMEFGSISVVVDPKLTKVFARLPNIKVMSGWAAPAATAAKMPRMLSITSKGVEKLFGLSLGGTMDSCRSTYRKRVKKDAGGM